MNWFKRGKNDDKVLSDVTAPVDIESTQKEEKKSVSFFEKLKAGLKKTQEAVFGRLDDVFYAFRSVDEELFEELEEVLISADIGVDTSVYMIDMLRKAAREKNIKEPAELKDELKGIISDILSSQDTECHVEDGLNVIMVIGVNGVGKTTSI